MIKGRSRYIGFGVTIGFVALLVWRTDVHELLSALTEANYAWVIPAVATTVASYALRTVRWERILRPIRVLSYGTLLPVVFIGFMANNLLPARMGEVVRAYALGRKTGLSKSMSLATILLERLCDGITLVAVLGVVAVIYPLPSWGGRGGLLAGGVFLLGSVGAAFALSREKTTLTILERLLERLPGDLGSRIHTKIGSFIIGLGVLRSGRAVVALASWSVLIWTVETSTYFFVLKSVHPVLQSGTLVIAALLLVVTINLGILIPSAPGYVGAYQAFGILALGAFGVPYSMAFAITIVAHTEQLITVTGIGLFFLARESLSLGRLTVDSATPSSAASATGA